MSKDNKPFSAQVLSYSQAENHKSEFTEGDILYFPDKGMPIPANPVGSADSVDKGKIPIVNASGQWELKTIEQIIPSAETVRY